MGLKKGDILDEHKRHPHSCGLMIKVMAGGEGFEKVVCCGHDLTDADVTPVFSRGAGRRRGALQPAALLDEKKLHPDSCGLRVMILDGGEGFQEIVCCGHSLRLNAVKEFRYGDAQRGPSSDPDPGPDSAPGPDSTGTDPDPGPTGTA